MPRPTTKQDLLTAGNDQYKKLWELIDSMNEIDRVSTLSRDNDKNVRDVLVHLYQWHELLLKWVKANKGGDQKPFLPETYNWKTYGEMNIEFWKNHRDTSFDQAKEMVNESHDEVMKMIGKFTNDELFSKGHIAWTGGSTLGSYCVSVTSSHYDWAIKKIKKHIILLRSKR